jgi:ATP-binding cassette subfamily B protein
VLRLSSSLFNELRDAVFARVRYHAMHLIALGVFKHLHTLDLSFHLNRRIGGITRDIDRGTQSVSTLLSIFVFNILPSFFEIILVIGLLWANYDIFFAGQHIGLVKCIHDPLKCYWHSYICQFSDNQEQGCQNNTGAHL